jgi:sialate O-acetylesterase
MGIITVPMRDRRRSTSFVAQVVVILGLMASTPVASAAHPFVSPVFGDNMVLQRGKVNTIWGWANTGDVIRVEIPGHTNAVAIVGEQGRWEAKLRPPDTRDPFTLTISGTQTISFTNILSGDVWLCGGQSNMEFPLSRARNGAEAVTAAHRPQIRFFKVRSQPGYAPKAVVQGAWKVCSPETISTDGGFSAIGYFFAEALQRATNVPIGLIQDCLGGTPAESWTSAGTLRRLGGFDAALGEVERLRARGGIEYGNFISHWYDEFDIGLRGQTWHHPDLNENDWRRVTLPGGFAELGVPTAPTVCYFRKTIVLPSPLPAGTAKILLGVVERMDTTHINGRWVGASAWVENPRLYSIGEGILRPGTNLISVRVLKTASDGGFRSKPEQLKLVLGDGAEIPLAGDWKGRLSVDASPPHSLPMGYENWPTMPAVLYNGMIAPVAPLAISGALWYQGEANAGRAAQYRALLPAMIADWRQAFQQGDFPFYIVSLAAFMQRKDSPGDDSWAELREAQAFAARTVSNSGLALAIDLGDAKDIHPIDKKEVGERLALCALANHYGKKVVFSGPVFDRAEILPGAVRVRFKHADGGLIGRGDKLGEFAVAGADRKWFWAEARIEGESVLVSSDRVSEPRFVRYAWQSNPLATLYNGAGLPAVPFRTDH